MTNPDRTVSATQKDPLSLAALCESFGVDERTLCEALWSSPNARGYLFGSISEILLRKYLERAGYELQRIKEKWVGAKLHHGDFYVRKGRGGWFVLESKGVKSNAEKWRKTRLAPKGGSDLRAWLEKKKKGDIGAWWRRCPPQRREAILASNLFDRAKVIDTHFVSGRGGKAGRAIATPRKDEFHVMALDLFLRTGRHEYIFARATDLEPATQDQAHLKQNYLIDILVPGVPGEVLLPPPWSRDFDEIFRGLKKPVQESDRQVDDRQPGARAAGVDLLEDLEANAVED